MDSERPTPLLEDSEETRKRLEAWLSQQRGQEISIPALTIPPATGMSNVTLLFDIAWEEAGQTRKEACVGRLQPAIERPVFPSYDLSLQYRVMESLGRNSDIPVPGLRGLETDPSVLGVPFYIMEYIEGRIPGDMPPYNMDGWMLHETTEEQRASMWRAAVATMARLHRLDPGSLELPALGDPRETPLQQQLTYWQDYLDWAMEGTGHSIGQAALDWLRANQPADEPTAICWGDARIGNIIFRNSLDGVAALLDWEMAVAGNPVQDLAWFNYLDACFAEGLGMPRLAGLPSYEETVEQWREATGLPVRDYDYYQVFAAMRFGLIMARIMLATGQDGEVQGNFACQLLQKTLDRVAA